MNIQYKIGETLIVQLEDECFVGELKLINKDRTRIELSNVFDFNTGEKICGNQIFYKSDIKSIKRIKKDVNDSTPVEELNPPLNTSNGTDKVETSLLSTHELQEIETLSRNAHYIIKTDRFYHDAIKDMYRQNEIVLNVESCQAGRNIRTTIITIATRQNVYIFDILSLGRIFPELKDVLEALHPKKVIHDSRKIVDNLKYRQGVQLEGIFDTYTAHIGIGGDKKVWNLEDCVKTYLNLPDTFSFSDKDVNWHERPLAENLKIITAKKTLFAYKFYDRILHDYILTKFYKTCAIFANVYSNNKDSVEVASDMASNKNSSINDIEDIDVDLAVSVETER